MLRDVATAPADDLGAASEADAEALDHVAKLQSAIDLAEVEKVLEAVAWADRHPALDPVDSAWPVRRLVPTPFSDGHAEADELDARRGEISFDLPGVHEMAIPEFAAALGLPTRAGQQLMLDGLQLRHRMPRTWRAMTAGDVQAWRARRIAQRTLTEPADVAAYVDERVAHLAQRVGLVTIDRLIDEALLRMHPEELELRRAERRESRRVDVNVGDGSADGLTYIDITTDTLDGLEFEATICAIARRLGELGDDDSLDVRRSKAIGIIADPDAVKALLEPAAGSDAPARRPRKQVVLHVHLSDAAVTGSEVVGRSDLQRRPVLAETIREWAGRRDIDFKVQPVIDLRDDVAVGAYEIPDRIKRHVELRTPTCAFPWCDHPSERCDKDHRIPFDAGGETSTANLGPLCRRHHRLKTFTAWRYEAMTPTTYLWTSPQGRRYLVDNSGTTAVT